MVRSVARVKRLPASAQRHGLDPNPAARTPNASDRVAQLDLDAAQVKEVNTLGTSALREARRFAG